MKILVIEDSERLRRALGEGLRKSGFTVDLAADGEAGLALSQTQEHDLIILDLMLPKLDGLSLLKCLRQQGSKSHVLILSARDQAQDRVSGLNLGADDYLVKPFDFDELLARVNALLRRRYEHKQPSIVIGGLNIDTNTRTVRRAGTAIPLTRLEYRLLELLLFRRGRVKTRAQIFEHLYDLGSENGSNVVEVLVYSLRRKLQSDGESDLIVTRRGQGYLIEAG